MEVSIELYKKLLEKGYKNCSSKERKVYIACKDKYGSDLVVAHMNEAKSVPEKSIGEALGIGDPKGAPDDQIVIKRAELEGMMKKMLADQKEELQVMGPEDQLNVWKPKKTEGPPIRYAFMKKYRKDSESPLGMITEFKHHRWDQDERTREMNKDIYKMTVLYDNGEEETTEISLMEFSKLTEYEKVKIIKMDKEEKELVSGYVHKPRVKNGYAMRGTNYPADGVKVPMTVTTAEYTATIVRENGQKLVLPEKYLNQ